jgi:hypothetical protein
VAEGEEASISGKQAGDRRLPPRKARQSTPPEAIRWKREWAEVGSKRTTMAVDGWGTSRRAVGKADEALAG